MLSNDNRGAHYIDFDSQKQTDNAPCEIRVIHTQLRNGHIDTRILLKFKQNLGSLLNDSERVEEAADHLFTTTTFKKDMESHAAQNPFLDQDKVSVNTPLYGGNTTVTAFFNSLDEALDAVAEKGYITEEQKQEASEHFAIPQAERLEKFVPNQSLARGN